MNILENSNDKIDNEVSVLGQKIVDTEASGKPANILATWIGMGVFFLFVVIAFTVASSIKKGA